MPPKNLASRKRRPQADVAQADCDSQSLPAAEETATPLKRKQPPRKPKFTPPLKQPESEPVESGSACSSPSASGFIVVPRAEKEKEKEKKMKKSSASKIFSDDDEIALLKGLAVFWADGRNNKWAEFHLSVKDDLGNHFTKTQLSEKIRSLKRKFERNLARANEGEIDLSDPHESAVFELSKALWGDDFGIAPEKKKQIVEIENGNNEVKGQMGENENGDNEVKGQMGENENGENVVKGQIGENGNEEVNKILTGTEQVVENDGSKKKKKKNKKKKKRKEMGEGEPNKEMSNREQRIGDSFEEGDVQDAANTILSIRKLVNESEVVDGEGNKKSEVVDGEGNKKSEVVDGEGNKESEVVDGEGNKESKVVDGEGNKKSEVVDGEDNKKSDVVDGEGNKKSKVVDGEGNKKSRKKKRKQGEERDEGKELVKEGMLVDDGQDEGNNDGERKKKMKKTKLVEECGEANKVAVEQKEVDEHPAKVEISEEMNRVEQHDKEEELLKEGKQADEHEQQDKKSKRRKQVGGHDLKKDLAKQGKQVDDHAEEHNIPAKGKPEMGIRVEDFQSAYPLLYTSYNISGYPKVPMDKCVLIGREKAQEFEQKWCELKAEEHRLELKRIELMISRGKRN